MRRLPNLMKSTPPPSPGSVQGNPGQPAKYVDLYGLSKPPFGEAVDSAGYILFGSHRRTFELLTDHIVRGIGVVLLHGEEGIGKTEILLAAASVAAQTGRPAIMISRPKDGRINLAQFVSALQGEPSAENTKTDRVVEDFVASSPGALLVDDIDLLPDECMHLLLALAQAIPKDLTSPAIVLTYAADPAALAARPDLAQLASLARNTIRLSRLGPTESRQYIERSLWIAGGTTRRLITPDAMKLLISRSGGVPGIINRLMEAAFTTGFARADTMITAKTVAAAMGPIAPRPSHQTSAVPGMTGRVVQIAAAGLLVAGATVFLYQGLNGHTQHPSPAAPPHVAVPPLPAPTSNVEQAVAAKPIDTLPPELIAALMKRGDQSLGLGDIAAARLLFQCAAEAGNAAAATSLGETYDPGFVAQGGKSDPVSAVAWYRKAVALGDPRAADLIQRLESH